MQISDILAQMGGVQSVARELGVSPQQAESGAAALLPAILGGFQKQQAQTGAGGLGGLLGQLGGGGLLDNVLSPEPTDVGLGNNVLGQIFGSKDTSRAVAANAATKTGLDPALLRKLLPIIAMMAAGYMAKQHGSAGAHAAPGGGGLGGLLGGLLGGGQGSSPQGGLAGMLDANGNGNPLDDILGMAGKLMR
ncbi:MAG: DUF937 domain-containing protein [Steroidobacteraceae bacterium]